MGTGSPGGAAGRVGSDKCKDSENFDPFSTYNFKSTPKSKSIYIASMSVLLYETQVNTTN